MLKSSNDDKNFFSQPRDHFSLELFLNQDLSWDALSTSDFFWHPHISFLISKYFLLELRFLHFEFVPTSRFFFLDFEISNPWHQDFVHIFLFQLRYFCSLTLNVFFIFPPWLLVLSTSNSLDFDLDMCCSFEISNLRHRNIPTYPTIFTLDSEILFPWPRHLFQPRDFFSLTFKFFDLEICPASRFLTFDKEIFSGYIFIFDFEILLRWTRHHFRARDFSSLAFRLFDLEFLALQPQRVIQLRYFQASSSKYLFAPTFLISDFRIHSSFFRPWDFSCSALSEPPDFFTSICSDFNFFIQDLDLVSTPWHRDFSASLHNFFFVSRFFYLDYPISFDVDISALWLHPQNFSFFSMEIFCYFEIFLLRPRDSLSLEILSLQGFFTSTSKLFISEIFSDPFSIENFIYYYFILLFRSVFYFELFKSSTNLTISRYQIFNNSVLSFHF